MLGVKGDGMRKDLVAKAIVMDENGNCLLLRRSASHPDMAGKPDLPGGVVDEGESIPAAVAREIEEEAGIAAPVTNDELLYANTSAYNNDRSVTRFLFVVRVPGDKPTVTISWEHDQYQWVPFDHLDQQMTHPIYQAGIQYIQAHKLIEV